MNLGVKIRGVNKVRAKLRKLAREQPEKFKRAMDEVTSRAADAARRVCPVDTGNLRGSIDHDVKDIKGEIIGMVFTPVYYGIYVHFGTSKMTARPFMNRAIEVLSRNAVPTFRKYLGF